MRRCTFSHRFTDIGNYIVIRVHHGNIRRADQLHVLLKMRLGGDLLFLTILLKIPHHFTQL